MTFVGLTVRVKDGCPHLRAVALGADGRLAGQPFQYLASKDHTLADMVHEVGDAFQGWLASLNSLDTVVMREGGDAHKAGLDVPRKTRLRAEGAVLAVARGKTTRVIVMSGQKVGTTCGGSKADD